MTQTYYNSNTDISVWLRTCTEEIVEPRPGKITGAIPEWLSGSLLRNGPGLIKFGEHEVQHLFDGSALLHRFAISRGNVTYQCKFLRSDYYQKNTAAGRIVSSQFGTRSVPDPCKTIFHRVASYFYTQEEEQCEEDNAMISVYPFGDEIYAFTEIPGIYRINPENLDTEEKVDIAKYVNIVNQTSHPHVLNDGTVYNLAMTVSSTGTQHSIIHFPPKGTEDSRKFMFENAKIVTSIPARWSLHPSYMHTFGITDNFFVIVQQPLSVSIPQIFIRKVSDQPMMSTFQWYGNEMTEISVVCRKTGALKQKYFANPFFYLHIINQYERDDCIFIDICSYKDPSMLNCMYLKAMREIHENPDYASLFRSQPIRFVLPLNPTTDPDEEIVLPQNTEAKAHLQKDGKVFVEPEKICYRGCETPRINYEKNMGKPYRFFYAISADVDSENPGTVIKVDTLEKKCLTWCEVNCYPSEPVFVASPNSIDEDDGILLSALVWGGEESQRVGLVVLRAKDMTELGRAEFETPSPVPKCLHGWFLPNSQF